MHARFIALSTTQARMLQAGAPDANRQVPQVSISDGDGNPCRHCLREIPAGAPMLILAWRPFTTLQPYAEVGPIFLCAEPCARHPENEGIPALYRDREMLIRGYDADERILYGTGRSLPMSRLDEALGKLFELPALSFLHARSPTNNCYHFRIEAGGD